VTFTLTQPYVQESAAEGTVPCSARDGFSSRMAHKRLTDFFRLESAMVRPDLVEAYARRLVAAFSSDLGSRVESVQRTISEGADSYIVEWKAMCENGAEIRLSAAVLAPRRPRKPTEPRPAELEELRDLGISPEDCDPQ
jgi:hypothetical protein